MDIIKSFKVRMHMNYAAYESKLRENPDAISDILGTFISDMSEGPKEEIIKFFNLEDEDADGLDKGTYAIGYKIIGEDADAKVIAVNIRIDIRTADASETLLPNNDTLDKIPSVSDMLASGLASSQDISVGTVIDTEGDVVVDDDDDKSTETADPDSVVSEPDEDVWEDADPSEVPFEDSKEPVEEVSEETTEE